MHDPLRNCHPDRSACAFEQARSGGIVASSLQQEIHSQALPLVFFRGSDL